MISDRRLPHAANATNCANSNKPAAITHSDCSHDKVPDLEEQPEAAEGEAALHDPEAGELPVGNGKTSRSREQSIKVARRGKSAAQAATNATPVVHAAHAQDAPPPGTQIMVRYLKVMR
jgi:hypothetical protein